MRKARMIALFLILSALVSVFAGCNGTSGETKPQESETAGGPELDEKWMELDFENEDLIINVSVFRNEENTFRAADIYSRGPESISSAADTVEKMIYDRNATIASALDVNVIWEETNIRVGLNQPIFEQFVKLSPENTPDICITDIYDTIHCMLTGTLQNLYDNYGEESPADGKRNYFDFDAECWYTEYMAGTTMRQDKMYMVAGDYFIDMIRWSHVIYVNRTMFDELGVMGYDMEQLYEDVVDRVWDYEWFTIFIESAGRDANNDGVYDAKAGEQVGFAASNHMEYVFSRNTGLSVVGWEGEVCNSKAYVIENNSDMFDFLGFYSDLYHTPGIMDTRTDLLAPTVLFLEGNVLFALSKMGEMESEQVRNSEVQKGILPIPLYNATLQEDYYTMVHDQADIGSILNNVRRFSAATAYLQLANETSVDILTEYYEKTLKLKYTEDADDKAMIDLIHDRIVSPFELIVARLVVSGGTYLPGAPYTGPELHTIVLEGARDGNFSSAYQKGVEGWKKNLAHMEEIFAGLN